MNTTPTSRPSKHVSSRRNQNRAKQSRQPTPSPAPEPQSEQPIAMGSQQLEGLTDSQSFPPLARSLEIAPMVEENVGAAERKEETESVETASVDTPLVDVSSGEDDERKVSFMQQAEEGSELGQSKAPVLAPESTSPAYLSRQFHTVQSYLPSTPIKTNLIPSPFSAPKISTVTVSGTSSSRPTMQPSGEHFESTIDARRRDAGRDRDGDMRERSNTVTSRNIRVRAGTAGSEDDRDRGPSSKAQRYPHTTANTTEEITFSSFSTISPPTVSSTKRLLFVGYQAGLQIWDATDLGEVHELLNLRQPAPIVYASILPNPSEWTSGSRRSDAFANERPLLGMISNEDGIRNLLVYSLATHALVQKLEFSGSDVVSFEANDRFLVVSTPSPLTLHILCSASFDTLHIISSDFLLPTLHSNPSTRSASPLYAGEMSPVDLPTPSSTFTLSSRLLAFASRSPTITSPSFNPVRPRTAHQPPAMHIGPMKITQADLGAAAMKVGGGLLSGMKTLGALAVAAARGDGATPPHAATTIQADRGSPGWKNTFFSRSAPAAAGGSRHERRFSHGSTSSGSRRHGHDVSGISPEDDALTSGTSSPSRGAAYLTILDLQPLLSSNAETEPETIAEFIALDDQPITKLAFSADGTCISVAPRDGTVVRVFRLRPRGPARAFSASVPGTVALVKKDRRRSAGKGHKRHSSGSTPNPIAAPSSSNAGAVRNWVLNLTSGFAGFSDFDSGGAVTGAGVGDGALGMTEGAPWHIYDLRRGRTTGVIEDMVWNADGRWVAVGTKKGTVHVFATNPYGGKPDEASHLEGRVRNVNELQPLSVELSPIIRLRPQHLASSDRPLVPLSFTFVQSSLSSLPPSLLPLAGAPPSTTPPSVHSSPRKRPISLSPRLRQSGSHFQDVLVFDPTDGTLALRRMTLSTHAADPSSLLSALPFTGGHSTHSTSVSLPGSGGVGRLSSSPPVGGDGALSKIGERHAELSAKDSVVATWKLMREPGSKEAKSCVWNEGARENREHRLVTRPDWLSNAELTTHSRSRQLLPGAIYLSHQFHFYALGEDYHALVRRGFLEVPSTEIRVRKEVQISAYASGHGESFVQASTTPQEIQRARSSFDEPLASAISADLDYSGTSPPVIPMLPNGGAPRSGSFKTPIPIRTVASGLSEGVNEGIGRLRREIGKVRSPRLLPRADGGAGGAIVPLEFDEEDEDFLERKEHEQDNEHKQEQPLHEHDDDSTSRGGGDSGASISTPSTSAIALAGEQWDGWGPEETHAIEEVERFDEISAAGFMDEEIRVADRRRKNKRS